MNVMPHHYLVNLKTISLLLIATIVYLLIASLTSMIDRVCKIYLIFEFHFINSINYILII